MKSAPSKKSWKLPVTKAGIIRLPPELREAAFLWEGDTVQATAFADADGYGIVLRVEPHGLTREQIQRAEQRALRELARDKKAG
jgi:bifunctional DNA-binding transcriptional regulator/antitoxin component of YhaV-PrlF toxin-antitoxin module